MGTTMPLPMAISDRLSVCLGISSRDEWLSSLRDRTNFGTTHRRQDYGNVLKHFHKGKLGNLKYYTRHADQFPELRVLKIKDVESVYHNQFHSQAMEARYDLVAQAYLLSYL